MSRDLSQKDMQIMYRLAPEIREKESVPYRSILPPVSKFYAASVEDFRKRLGNLSDEELKYITELIFEGQECLRCLEEPYVLAFIDVTGQRLPLEISENLKGIYGLLK
ncbi:conserved hypothetical protein [Methanosalsum zhilinae DSM 4017]|uniref:Uncharacterized protein n=1 Tax=Methanosalsum zhilinae (strain DSM 4017 / NBRC 107636 / OCM 62 / WeN5) TaxID=679901 RepID=F7XNM9_METZD|nr:hypothetical protein [Methanosalsum zhilinae]AEH60130.1 conserved hypothetical protein [Methanosalsum zhilinae DSM 4017]